MLKWEEQGDELEHDALAPARGCFYGLVISVIAWAIIGLIVWRF